MEPILKYKTRNNSNPKGKPRVYFACHPEDFEMTFNRISDQILQKQNCTIYFHESSLVLQEDELKDALSQMQLVVIPITTKFLIEENQAYKSVYKIAKKSNIPVLPIMQEKNIEVLFNEKCGDIQYLEEFVSDPTAIGYEEKLEKFLNSVLISDELAEKIRNAFDAYIFLSYRKKDRKYAQELMRLIHKNDFCRDIAIWYDEFLVPGENFNDAIADALKKSKLFALVVTPNLVNEENYVMTTEYPMAKERNMLILPAESVTTDKEELRSKFTDIPDCTDAHDEKMLSDSMLQAVKALAIESNDSSPKHNFFIGLAYLSGIDVEVDYNRALSLIKSAAEAGLIEAKEKLVSMYENGIGVKRDCFQAMKWQYEVVENYYETYFNNPSQQVLEEVIFAVHTLAHACLNASVLDHAQDHFTTMMELVEDLAEYDVTISYEKKIDALNGLYRVCLAKGEYEKAGEYIVEILDILENHLTYQDATKAMYYSNAGLSYYFEQNTQLAKEYYNRAIEYLDACEDKDIDYLIIKTRVYINMGTLMLSLKNYDSAIENYDIALQTSEEVNKIANDKYVDDIFTCYASLGYVYFSMGNLEQMDIVLKKFFNKIYKEFKGEKRTTWLSNKAELQNLIGQLYWKRGEFDIAEKHYAKSLRYYEEYNFMEVNPFEADIALVHNNIAVMKSDSGEFEEAIKHYKIACEKFDVVSQKEKKYRENKAFVDFNISICLYHNRDYKEAEKYAHSALELYKTMYAEGSVQFAEELKNVGKQLLEICFKRKRFIKGFKCYYGAISMINES